MKELTGDIEAFRELTGEELDRVRAIAEARHYEPGQVILRQGMPADAVYVLLEGAVRVTAILSEGDDEVGPEEEILVRLRAGELVGELSFVTGEPPSLSVVAEEATFAAALPHRALRELIESDAHVCRKLLFAITRTLVARLKDTGRELVLTRYFIRGR